MLPRDKYTLFDKKEKTYRKGIHSKSLPHAGWFCTIFFFGGRGLSEALECQLHKILQNLHLELPKWTRVSQRVNPPGF